MPRLNKYDRVHLAHLSDYQRQVDAIYAEAAREAARLAAQIRDFNASAAFSFADYPMTRKRCDALLERLKNGLFGVVANGMRSEWTLANNKNDELSRQVFGANVGRLSQAQYRRYFSTNGAARDAFIARREAGMNLSDRVWNYTSQFKAEMEQVCDIGIRNGMSAEEMQRDLQQYLKNPDNFFRRFRYKEGVDESGKPLYGRKWKKRYWDDDEQGYKWEDVDLNDPKYQYGRGVYRSSYKNARRLAVTETNIAYRTADHLRWQQMDFVVGIHIEPSNTNHPVVDICDILAGDYPKDFKWTGWHPHCRCHATSILKTEEEMAEDNERILRGEEPLEDSVNAINNVPLGFTKWIKRNSSPSLKVNSIQTEHVPLETKEYIGGLSGKIILPISPSKERQVELIMEMTGANRATAEQYREAVHSFSYQWDKEIRQYQRGDMVSLRDGHSLEQVQVKANTLEEFISRSPQWISPTYRGIGVNEETYKRILQNLSDGEFDMGGVASWTSVRRNAEKYAIDQRFDSSKLIVFECDKQIKATSIRHLSQFAAEEEVLVSSNVKYRIVGKPKIEKIGRNEVTIIQIEPIQDKILDKLSFAAARGKAPYFVTDNIEWFQTISKVKFGSGFAEIHSEVNRRDSDFKKLWEIARVKAGRGNTCTLTPKLARNSKFDYDEIYGGLKGTRYYGKCPDLKVETKDGKTLWYEHEGFESDNPKRAFSNMMNHGLKQSSRIIIDRPNLTERYMRNSIIKRVKDGAIIDEVWIREVDGRLTKLY